MLSARTGLPGSKRNSALEHYKQHYKQKDTPPLPQMLGANFPRGREPQGSVPSLDGGLLMGVQP